MPTMLKNLLRQEESFMSLLARVFLLVLFLGLGTLQFFVNTEAGYAQSVPAAVKSDHSPTPNQPKCGTTVDCADKLGPHLLKYFVLSMFLEILLTLVFKAEQVFTWLQGRTWKTPVAIGLGLSAAWGLDFNISRSLFETLTIDPSWAGENGGKAYVILMNVLDGVLLAGGNHSFYRIFAKLGIHDPFKQMVRAAV